MEQKVIALIITGMALVTYLPRMIPAMALSSRRLNPLAERWLSHVPAAILAALLAPSLLAPEGRIQASADNLFLWIAVPCFILAIRTKSFFGVVALGMGLLAAARLFI
ncbi:AzlD domain-containing protein [Desulfovibrio aminophilus]|nr:AzlD domain-containing protein [Desulfovibrio aminophilus]MCM0754976.1 AzlD domain-containing protein [Desulfovibrio aminophilus]